MNFISSGHPVLDQVLGVPGYPRGRITELLGPAWAGKTTLALQAAAECQRQGGLVSFIDVRHAFDPHYAKELGVDTAGLLVSQPEDAMAALTQAHTLVSTGTIDLLILDSPIAPTGVQHWEMKKLIGGLTPSTGFEGACVLVTTRDTTHEHGLLLRYYASLRMHISPASNGLTRVKVVKTRLFPPFTSTELDLRNKKVTQ